MHKLRVAMTGEKGCLASYFRDACKEYNAKIVPWSHDHDILCLFGAKTDVDRCQEHPQEAWQSNMVSLYTHLTYTKVCNKPKKVVFISSDFVNVPGNVYGATKLAGEVMVRSLFPDNHLIVRAQSFYGDGGKSWASKLRAQLKSGEPVYAISDQWVQPTYYADFALSLGVLIKQDICGTVSFGTSDICSWFEFAKEMESYLKTSTPIHPVSAASLKRSAPRPSLSVFSSLEYEDKTGNKYRHWSEGLVEYIGDMAWKEDLENGDV